MPEINADRILTKIRELPPLPVVVQKLLEVVGDDHSSARDINAVLSADQALTGKVLKLVNSSFYGFSGNVSTLTRAVVILGYSAIRNLAIGISAYETLKKVKSPVNWEEFWLHAITCAAGSQALANRLKYPEPEEAFIAGLMHDVGYFLLNALAPDEFAGAGGKQVFGRPERETEVIGASHVEIGSRLLEFWKLPPQLCRVARFHHSPKHADYAKDPLVTIVALADTLAGVTGSAYVENPDKENLLVYTEKLGMSMSAYGALLPEIMRRVKDAREFLNIADESVKSALRLEGAEMPNIVIVSSDENRRQWVEALLGNYGYHAVGISALSPTSEQSEQVDLAILDTAGLKPEPMEKLAACLAGLGIPLALLADEHYSAPVSLVDCACLPLIFAKEEVDKLFRRPG